MSNKIFSLSDARKYAKRRMPRMTFDYIDGSAGDERACALNVEAIEAIRMLPRVLLNGACSMKTGNCRSVSRRWACVI